MKKLIFALVVLFAVTGICAYAEEMDIRVILDGKEVVYDVKPFVENETVLVPVRKTFESFGMEVTWDDETKTAFAFGKGIAIVLKLDSNKALVMNEEVELRAPPRAVNGRLLVPLRFIGESLGGNVEWVQETKTVVIDTKTSSGQVVDKIIVPPLIFQ